MFEKIKGIQCPHCETFIEMPTLVAENNRLRRELEQLKAGWKSDDCLQDGPPLDIRIAEAVHLAFTRRPDALSVRKRLMHPYKIYADYDAMNYARDVIIGVLNTLLRELPPSRIRSLERRLSDELSEAVGCYTRSGNHPAPPHLQSAEVQPTHSDQDGQPDGRPGT
ncbi:hypothetical protein [Marinobacter oulmenensis]|uniref:Uncharacterized protein n=1 Tax=Marinobacter oulmenensis TaxID=643747 RepID=A0A840UKB5_9GAMM|nr:hypothetical protein [Marinobacter oulmenensis]MBB5321178.1 hypothetical protein [Marinobacter oulmenensis]